MAEVRRFAVEGLEQAARRGGPGGRAAPRARRRPHPVAGDGLPPELEFRTKGQLARELCADAEADGIAPDFYTGDEVYGNCPELRTHFEETGQGYVLRVPSNVQVTMPSGDTLTCAVTAALLRDRTDTQAPEPLHPDQPPPPDIGMIPFTAPEIKRLLADANSPTAAERPHTALAGLATHPPSTLTTVPQARKTSTRHQEHPGQLTNGGCRTGLRR